MERKIIKIGNSQGILIPSVYLEELGLTQGDTVELEMDSKAGFMILRNKKTTTDDRDFEGLIKSVVDDYLKNIDE